ncbi:amino acid deaminase [Massilia forsythiae]|uniref:Amino acid deaminase n=1 Tax=Massilia forsythiae TaxID=2728020 RepID=A0A7Z2ZS49_9BURK|nr:amino acid deaminase [Massilia forsythiae]QJD99918.1 amino acid deaminase [Massilia forsythiae]
MSLLPGVLSLSELEEQRLPPGTKGLAIGAPLRQGAIGVQGWNVLRGDTGLPVAVLKTAALRHNLAWMRDFCARHGASLAPHGKTTMCPQLFGAQLAHGAWGITLATPAQVQVAHRFGVRRVLLANQLVAPGDLRIVLALLRDDPEFDCVVLADSLAGVARLAEAVAAQPLTATASAAVARPLPVLVELGLQGKRAGCRTPEAALTVARALAGSPGLVLAGFEGYEGLLVSHDHEADLGAVRAFVDALCALVPAADDEGLFQGGEIMVSAGGSAYFDLVARGFASMPELSRPLRPILRSGCYVTSDHGLYRAALAQLDAREGAVSAGAASADGLRPALEIWSVVQSRPEPDLAILGMGKRDASHDAGLPQPLLCHRPGPGLPTALPAGCEIVKLNDQHAYLRLPEGPVRAALQVGDLVGCGISHPCTTFDRWPLLLGVDDDYAVRGAFNTFF